MEQLFARAKTFLGLFYREMGLSDLEGRLEVVKKEIEGQGTYTHTFDEIQFGARVAWRNSNRCIGRLFWKGLMVRDYRQINEPAAVAEELGNHLDIAWNGGKIKPVITIFQPEDNKAQNNVRIWNPQLLSYAGYSKGTDKVIGDPRMVEFTQLCAELGWTGAGTPFDKLPWVIRRGMEKPLIFQVPEGKVREISLVHPVYEWFEDLGLKWYAIPVISNMTLEMGGIKYPASPFNGWYMGTEIGARNLADENRYNMLPEIARCMGLPVKDKRFLWKDRALVELNRAVLHSFYNNGVRIDDHHTAADRFVRFVEEENKEGRKVTGDWSWIVPPLSGSTTQVFHMEMDNTVHSPNYYYRLPEWEVNNVEMKQKAAGCPFHIH